MTAETILVVEDEEDILDLVKFNLKREGYRVFGVTHGAKAIPLGGKGGTMGFDNW